MEEADGSQGSADRPKDPRSTALTIEKEAVIVALRRHTLLPLDDCLYAGASPCGLAGGFP